MAVQISTPQRPVNVVLRSFARQAATALRRNLATQHVFPYEVYPGYKQVNEERKKKGMWYSTGEGYKSIQTRVVSTPGNETIVLSFHGSSALMSTLQWLSTAELSDVDLFRLDHADDKNVIARASDGFASGFLLYNKDGYLPASVFWMKRFVRDDYKRCHKYFRNDVQKEKPKSNDDMYK